MNDFSPFSPSARSLWVFFFFLEKKRFGGVAMGVKGLGEEKGRE